MITALARQRGGDAIIALLAVTSGGCEGVQSALAGGGPEAARVVALTMTMTIGALIILLVVCVLLGLALFGAPRTRAWIANPRIIFHGGVVFPCVVLTALLLYGLLVLRWNPAVAEDGNALKVSVIAEQWWWRVRYHDGDGATFDSANELVVPVGRVIELELTTADVLHSFWVPAYAGKLDMVPGRTNTLRFVADETGVVRGQCAEFCGGAHALMSLYVVALPPGEFATWLDGERSAAQSPRDAVARSGAQLFTAAGCGSCHSVRGTDARGTIGPDLTHIGARRSLAAGVLPTTEAAFASWIAGGQVLKPGNHMPDYGLFEDHELRALAHYLAGLD